MVLILSRQSDISTNVVIEWLNYYNIPFYRLNDEDILTGDVSINFRLSDNTFQISGRRSICLSQIKVVWFRKFGFLESYDDFFNEFDASSNLKKFTYSEFDRIRKLLFKLLENKKWLYLKTNMPSKIEVLMIAKKNGIKIPKTVISNNKFDLEKEFKPEDELITKALGEAIKINFLNSRTPLLTQKFKLSELTYDRFFPSIFQKYVQKEFELRIFFIEEKYYPMAMFTQTNNKTSIDFRNYDLESPPRTVPYILPKKLECKLSNFMKELGVNTGSIDMIKSISGEYYFLEVNPTGQYAMTATPCNYPIDKEIAKFLKKANS